MPRVRTPSFIAEFPLRTSEAQERSLEVRLDAARQIYNAVLGEALRRLGRMRASIAYVAAREIPKGAARTEAFTACRKEHGFTSADLQKFAQGCRDACWIGHHLGSHDTQTTSLRAFRAVEQYAFGQRGRPRFKGKRGLHSVEGKANSVIRYTEGAVHWKGLVLPLMLDARDQDGWQSAALSCPTKYVRVLRRSVRGRVRWYAQLCQQGLSPQRRETSAGVVGADLGPSTIAAVAEGDATLETFCPGVEQPWKEMRRIERAMDRSRRATNPANYNPNGTPRSGRKQWIRSGGYQALRRARAEIERTLGAERKRAHGELANRILGQGTTVRLEALSYTAFQKSFGRSVKVRAPGRFVSMLTRKAVRAGGSVEAVSPWKTRLSQYDHTTDTYTKKPLSQRTHVLGDGSGLVQRDLYSAFLVRHVEQDKLDAWKAKQAFPGAGPLLEQAASRARQSASSEAGFPLPPLSAHHAPARQSGSPVQEGSSADEALPSKPHKGSRRQGEPAKSSLRIPGL